MPTIVDSHHKVLSAWAKYRSKLKKAPRLITLDHHTDTSAPFRNFFRKQRKSADFQSDEFIKFQNKHLQKIDFTDAQSIGAAITKLNNDEHIVAAIKTDIISSAFVLAHNAANTDLQTYKKHKIVCRTVNEKLDHNSVLKPDYDSVLESELIEKTIANFNLLLENSNEDSISDTPYILDIDLDYFNTFKSIEPSNSKAFESLAQKAGLITIATEPEYVESCAIDKGLTSDFLLEKIKSYLKNT